MEFKNNRFHRQDGLTVAEALITFVVLTALVVVALPNLNDARRAAALGSVASKIRGLLFRSRVWAIKEGRSSGVVFERRSDASWRCYVVCDGDDDGILRADIEAGRDPVLGEIFHFEMGGAGLGILKDEYVPDPSGKGRLRGNLEDPVRAGRGDIITFTPRGTATPSSVYLTDYRSRMRVLRIYGSTGRVIALRWKSGWRKWKGDRF